MVLRLSRVFCRILVGVVFTVSGFLKAVDPVGTSLKVSEYLQAFGLSGAAGVSDFTGFALAAAAVLCSVEFLTGIFILADWKQRLFPLAALCMTAFFFVLTLVSALTGLVRDCGCFGEALELSPWQTFYKNVVLLACSLVLCFVGKRRGEGGCSRKSSRARRLTLYAVSPLFILGVFFYSYRYLPLADFSDFRPGTDLTASSDARSAVRYETVFLYAKDGGTETFTIDNLPDSTWTYVDSRTTLLSGSEKEASRMELVLKDSDGAYLTDEVLGSKRPILFVSFYRSNADEKNIGRLGKVLEYLRNSSIADIYLLSSMTDGQTAALLEEMPGVTASLNGILYTDFKTLVTFNRSNGGLTLVNNGTIVAKWSAPGCSAGRISAAIGMNSLSENEGLSITAEAIDKGMEYINYRYAELYGGAQNITVIEIDPHYYTFGLLDFGGREKTSVMASEHGAVAAINGSFFDKEGGSVTYFQLDGRMLDTTEKNKIYDLLDGAVMVKEGRLSVIGWDPAKEKRFRGRAERAEESGKMTGRQSRTSLIVAPPVLVRNGRPTDPVMVSGLSTYQHPRSVVYEKKGRIGFMVIDGRSEGNATGMTMVQMQDFLTRVVGADIAINLDGGGSSTLWSKTFGGECRSEGFVLNMPCDNGKFDHLGERKVGNGILVYRK